jgi:uncharacterized membrane protein
MDEVFWGFIILLIVAGLVVAPAVTMFISIGNRRRQRELAKDISEIKSILYFGNAKKPEPEPVKEKIAETHINIPEIPIVQETPVPVSAQTPMPAPEVTIRPGQIKCESCNRFVSEKYSKCLYCGKELHSSSEVIEHETYLEIKSEPQEKKEIPQKEPNKIEAATKDILSKIWSWIIVGEEHRKEGVSVEYAVATNWLVRVGVLIIVVGIGFFLDYTSSRGWLRPLGKVSLALMTGSVFVAFGISLLDKRYHLIAQGLLGAGLAVFYGSVFSAFNLYHLIGTLTAFSLMALVTVGAGFLAVRFNSILLAIIGIIGGYSTPVFLSSGGGDLVGFYSYMLLLGIGVLGIAHKRSWHLLNALSFSGTWILVAVSLSEKYRPELFWQITLLLTAFFILFSTMIFIYQVLNSKRSTLIELIMLILNAGIYFALMNDLIRHRFDPEWSAAIALGLAAFYTVHVYLFLRKKGTDKGLSLSFIGLASFFLILTMPLLLSDQWLTLCWSVQALILLWLSAKLESRFLQTVSYILYLIVFIRFFAVDMSQSFSVSIPDDMNIASYLLILAQRLISFGIPAASIALAVRLIKKPAPASAGLALDPSNDIKPALKRPNAAIIASGAVFAMLFLYMHLEINRTLFLLWAPLRMPALSGLWIAACAYLLFLFSRTGSNILLKLLFIFTSAVIFKLFAYDLPMWGASHYHLRYIIRDGYSFLDAGMRLLDNGLIIAFFVYTFNILRKHADAEKMRNIFGFGSIILLLVYTSLEINSIMFHFVPGLRAGGISVFWALYALGLITGGLVKRIRPIRFSGLALFTFVAFKVFFSDLSKLDPLYKIVAFTLLGTVLLAGAFVYLRFQDRFDSKNTDDNLT